MNGVLTALAFGFVAVAVGVALVRNVRDPDGRGGRMRASLDQIASPKRLIALGLVVVVFLLVATVADPRRAPAAIFAGVVIAAGVGAIIWVARRSR